MGSQRVESLASGAVSLKVKTCVFAAGMLVLLSACAGSPGSAPDPSTPSSAVSASPVPLVNSTWREGDPGDAASVIGRLTLTEAGCFVLTDTHGRIAVDGLLWPEGFTAQTSGQLVRVVDGAGRVVATEGQVLQLGGGYGGDVRDACNSREGAAVFIIQAPVLTR